VFPIQVKEACAAAHAGARATLDASTHNLLERAERLEHEKQVMASIYSSVVELAARSGPALGRARVELGVVCT